MIISIHALLTESDSLTRKTLAYVSYFYPRSPYGERPLLLCRLFMTSQISIHALLTESDSHLSKLNTSQRVFLSTLSLRRATRRHRGNDRRPIHFYPRSPYGERLVGAPEGADTGNISIHALLTESDAVPCRILQM